MKCEKCGKRVEYIGELNVLKQEEGSILLVCKECLPIEKKCCNTCKHKSDIFKGSVLCDLYHAWFNEDFCCDSQWKPQGE